MGTAKVERWLKAYQKAWESRDSQAAARIFSDDREYYWMPLDPPARGPAGIAKWRSDFTQLPANSKIHMEGVLTAGFAEPGEYRIVREWWHLATS